MKYLGFVVALITAFGVGYYLSNPETCGAQCEQQLGSIPAASFDQQIQAGVSVLLDIRTAEEFGSGHIENAANIDFYKTAEFTGYLESLDKNQAYLIYCRSGNRSGQALQMMQEMGFTKVSDLAGGVVSWEQSGLPLVK